MNLTRRTKDTILSALLIIYGSILAISGSRIKPLRLEGDMGSGAFPMLIGGTLIFLAICLLINTFIIDKKNGEIVDKFFGENLKGGVLTIGAFIVYNTVVSIYVQAWGSAVKRFPLPAHADTPQNPESSAACLRERKE